MNKRDTKKKLKRVMDQAPNERMLDGYVFCCSRDLDYNGKTYGGIELHYFNVIERDTIYLLPKWNLEQSYIEQGYV